MNTRHGKKWNTNELLQLEREYHLLNLTVEEIAIRHNRSENAIFLKLVKEKELQDDYLSYRNSPRHVRRCDIFEIF
jgi:hypothetical protein